MKKKAIQFKGHVFIVERETPFTATAFAAIQPEYAEPFTIEDGRGGTEVLSISKIFKTDYSGNRFVSVYFSRGAKYPYSHKVIDATFKEKDNPRPPEEIELDDQVFILIDCEQQRMWIAGRANRALIAAWFKEKIGKEVYIKSILDEASFIETVKTLREVSFSVVPQLFNSANQDILSNNLTKDIFGFGAVKARLQFIYRNYEIGDLVRNKLRAILAQKELFEEITIVGRGDDNVEGILNLSSVAARIGIDVADDGKTQLYDPSKVFAEMISTLRGL